MSPQLRQGDSVPGGHLPQQRAQRPASACLRPSQQPSAQTGLYQCSATADQGHSWTLLLTPLLLPGLWLGSIECNMLSSMTQLSHWAIMTVMCNMLEAHARTCASKHTACAQDACGDAPVLDQHGHLAVPRNCDQSKPADMGVASENYTMTRHNTSTTEAGLFKGRWPRRAKHCPQEPASAP
jgi:hypothetical protein